MADEGKRPDAAPGAESSSKHEAGDWVDRLLDDVANLPPEPGEGMEYEMPIARVFKGVRRYRAELQREREGAAEAIGWVMLTGEPPEGETRGMWRGARGWARSEEILALSAGLRKQEPLKAVILALIAREIAARLDPADHSVEALSDLRARAEAELAAADIFADDYDSGIAALESALEIAEQGTGDPLLFARVIDLTASLYTNQRRFRDAARLLDLSSRIYRSEGKADLAGKALIKKGIVAGYANDFEGALRLFTEGLGYVDPRQDPGLVFVALHNFIDFSVKSGKFEAAKLLLWRSRPLYAAQSDDLTQLKRCWVEGKVAAGLGDPANAEAAFQAVRAGFGRHEMPYTQAIVSLDLCCVWLDQGRAAEAMALVEETLAIFRAYHIRREAIAALVLLTEALAIGAGTAAFVEIMAERLERLEYAPLRRPETGVE